MIINDQTNPEDKNDKTIYTCIQNLRGYNIYIPQDNIEQFYSNSKFYSGDYGLINLTVLKSFRRKRNYKADVYDKVNPPSVKLKFIDYIYIIPNKVIYIVYNTDLNYDDDLYNDLLNYYKIEEKY